ncbi:hypothetical protein [Ammoniphilus sp. 3BR4]|uniref:hypothetical protein n=1 Tax=Ammoniphilus sp. 3BR4 TaxID=3158265 RepID=UPI003466AEDE
MPNNPRKIMQLEQEAVEQQQDDRKARETVEDALNLSTPQQKYHQMHDQQDFNDK